MPQDPADIQRQIEATRAELASTVDQIADRVSPKRVAERSREHVKASLAANGGPVGTVAGFYGVSGGAKRTPAGDGSAAPSTSTELAVADAPAGGVATYGGAASLRWDRIGATAAVLALVAWLVARRARS